MADIVRYNYEKIQLRQIMSKNSFVIEVFSKEGSFIWVKNSKMFKTGHFIVVNMELLVLAKSRQTAGVFVGVGGIWPSPPCTYLSEWDLVL